MASGVFGTIYTWFQLTIDAFFAPKLSWAMRSRMLAGQPILLLAYSIAAAPWLFRRRPFTVEHLPIAPGRTLRALVFMAPKDSSSPSKSQRKLRPLHLDCHAGAFMGGLPEASAPFCERVAKETGAVVVATTYRFAPRHTFPAAHDDVDAVLAYLRANAEQKYGADPNLITVSGSSAGANLVIASSLSVPPGTIKASVTFYAPIDLRLHPADKPKPERFPKVDPLSFMLPLYDSYAGPVRPKERDNPRMSPILANIDYLPQKMLLVVAGLDITVHEQTTFFQRINEEKEKSPKYAARSFELLYLENAFHGWLEAPPSLLPPEWTQQAFGAGIKLIKAAQEESGW